MNDASPVASVERALKILKAFAQRSGTLSLSDLAQLTGFYKSTLLRLLQTLESQSFVTRLSTGVYQLGPAVQFLSDAYKRTFRLEPLIMPMLAKLAEETGESISFFVANGDVRSCLFRVEPNRDVRHTVLVGQPLPLHAGATGKVFQQFGHLSSVHAVKAGFELPVIRLGGGTDEITVVAGPVFQNGCELAGAMCISGPALRFDNKTALQVSGALLSALALLTRQLGGDDALFSDFGMGSPKKQRRPARGK